jgi:outer membrane receptor protein involved in Fe transport
MITRLLGLIVFGYLSCACTMAQVGRATILGSVIDSSGAPVQGVEIKITQIETNTVFTVATNEFGLYTMPGLRVGHYEVTATASGFKRAVRSGIVLEVDDNAEINFHLEIGALTESVEVAGEAPLIDTAGATVGKVIENARMTSLPVNGRTVLSLVLLTPSVRGHSVNEPGFGNRGAALSNFSVNGGPPATNNYTIDGTMNNSVRYGDAAVNPLVDTIEEFKVQSGVMSAEYGYTLGGVVNLVTKSGSNTFHGSLYEFLRNDKLDARNSFAALRTPLRYNQYGGVLGGPIRKDLTFFFFNYEEWRLALGTSILDIVPTPRERSGDFSQLRTASGGFIPVYDPATVRSNPSGSGLINDPFPGNIIPKDRLDRVSQNILQEFFPLPDRTPTNAFTNANNYQSIILTHRRAREETIKLDHRFSMKNSISFRYILWDHKDDNASGYWLDPVARLRNDDYSNRNFNVSDTHLFSPSVINELRVGALRVYFPAVAASVAGNWPQKLGLPANVPSLALPSAAIAGYRTFPAAASNQLLYMTALQLQDNVSIIKGKHALRFGFDIRKNEFNRSITSASSGLFNFASATTANYQSPAGTGSALASYLLGAVSNATVETDQPVSWEGWSQAYYAQDDWKVTRRLTLNLGLRYEYQQVPRERWDRISNFNPYGANPNDGTLGRLEFAGKDFGDAPVLPDYTNFSPRAGFALDLFGNAKTAIRGGYGIYYPSTFTTSFFSDVSQGFNSVQTVYLGPGGSTQIPAFQFQNGLPSPPIQPLGRALGPSAFESQGVNYVKVNGRTPYAQQFALTVQQQLPRGYLLEVGYSGNKGSRLVTGGGTTANGGAGGAYDLNQLDPKYYGLGQALNQQVPNPYAGKVSGIFGSPTITLQQSLRPYPYYNNINVTTPREGSSIYHSYLVNVEKRMSNGFVLLASYTFGKLLGEPTSVTLPGQAMSDQVNAGTGYRLGRFNRRLERSLDPTDSAKHFVLSSVYELPFGTGKRWSSSRALLNAFVGGWQLNGVLVLQDGLPMVIRGANNFIADRPNSTGVSGKLGDPSRYEWFDVTQFVNPAPFTIGNVARTLPDVRGPGIANIDLSVLKNTRVHERWNVQFRAESFNFANHVNLLQPNTTFVPGADGHNSSSTFGTITSSRDARIIQLGLKILF